MFYLKYKGKRLLIESDNVYTTCPLCGKERVVDLQDILGDGNSDLYGTAVYCEKCSAQRVTCTSRQKSAKTAKRKG